MDIFIIFLIVIIVLLSIYIFLVSHPQVRNSFSKELFVAFLVIYTILMLGFALIYFLIAEMGYIVLADQSLQSGPGHERFLQAFYFSGVTLMTVGYGDLTPVGFARLIALAEAAVGYLLPAAFLYKLMRH